MEQYFLPAEEINRYITHGLASIPLSRINWEGIAIKLVGTEILPKARYAWIKNGQVKISSGRNPAPKSALEISAEQPLSELIISPHRFHISDQSEYGSFLRKLRQGSRIFETQFQNSDGIRVAIEPVYSS